MDESVLDTIGSPSSRCRWGEAATVAAKLEWRPTGDFAAARARAFDLERETGAVQLRPFEIEAKVRAQYRTTGGEILDQVGDRRVDAFVASVGTGGAITGAGRRLRGAFPDVELITVEPRRTRPSRVALPAMIGSREWARGSTVR